MSDELFELGNALNRWKGAFQKSRDAGIAALHDVTGLGRDAADNARGRLSTRIIADHLGSTWRRYLASQQHSGRDIAGDGDDLRDFIRRFHPEAYHEMEPVITQIAGPPQRPQPAASHGPTQGGPGPAPGGANPPGGNPPGGNSGGPGPAPGGGGNPGGPTGGDQTPQSDADEYPPAGMTGDDLRQFHQQLRNYHEQESNRLGREAVAEHNKRNPDPDIFQRLADEQQAHRRWAQYHQQQMANPTPAPRQTGATATPTATRNAPARAAGTPMLRATRNQPTPNATGNVPPADDDVNQAEDTLRQHYQTRAARKQPRQPSTSASAPDDLTIPSMPQHTPPNVPGFLAKQGNYTKPEQADDLSIPYKPGEEPVTGSSPRQTTAVPGFLQKQRNRRGGPSLGDRFYGDMGSVGAANRQPRQFGRKTPDQAGQESPAPVDNQFAKTQLPRPYHGSENQQYNPEPESHSEQRRIMSLITDKLSDTKPGSPERQRLVNKIRGMQNNPDIVTRFPEIAQIHLPESRQLIEGRALSRKQVDQIMLRLAGIENDRGRLSTMTNDSYNDSHGGHGGPNPMGHGPSRGGSGGSYFNVNNIMTMQITREGLDAALNSRSPYVAIINTNDINAIKQIIDENNGVTNVQTIMRRAPHISITAFAAILFAMELSKGSGAQGQRPRAQRPEAQRPGATRGQGRP